MGRPLNKRFFKKGASGQSVSSATVNTAGSYSATTFPTVTFDAPSLSGGVTAVGHVATVGAVVGNVTANGSGYQYGDVLTVPTTSGTVTAASFTVNALTLVGVTVQSGGTSGWANGNTFTFSTGMAVNAVVSVTVNGGGVITGATVTTPGHRNSAAPANPVTPDSHTGTGAGTVTFNLVWGVYSATTPHTAGSYTSVTTAEMSTGVATTASPAGGTGAQLTFTYGIQSIAVTNQGSGYISAADAAITFGSGAAAATAVMAETSGGSPGLLPWAKVLGGSNVLPASIVSQKTTNGYDMTTTEGTSFVTLGTTDTPAPGGAYLLATDSYGSTYYVTKLTAHKCDLVRRSLNGTYEWATGADAKWSFAAPSFGVVQISNA